MCIPPSFTAQEIAAAAHVSGKQMAKTVIVKIGDQFAMVVIPANEHVNFVDLKSMTGETNIDLTREADFKNRISRMRSRCRHATVRKFIQYCYQRIPLESVSQ